MNLDLKSKADDLHNLFIMSVGDSVFLPTGGIFLETDIDFLDSIIYEGKPHREKSELIRIYADWHETVHMLQLFTSPFVHGHVFQIVRLALIAQRIHRNSAEPSYKSLSDEFTAHMERFSQPSFTKYSPHEIVETHAVIQGMLWLTGNETHKGLLNVAESIYERKSNYLKIWREMSEKVGEEVSTCLLPRICTLALQTDNPALVLSHLFNRIATERNGAIICKLSPIQLCDWANVDKNFITKSLRLRNRPLSHHPWQQLFSNKFDSYEAIEHPEERLNLIMGTNGPEAARIFSPVCKIYNDGEVPMKGEAMELYFDAWLELTHHIIEGFRLLNDAGETSTSD